ncbi:HNH endonuclease signature motif containing protein [Nocardia sp. NPDC051570]|uniref:HNH endonuclease signature motif containing protein n=1 Tax=Nocardia sp. NPDC051570 TaxID=3364324 RepID=UPI0037949384
MDGRYERRLEAKRRPAVIAACEVCDHDFEKRNSRSKACSPECQRVDIARQARKRYHQDTDFRERELSRGRVEAPPSVDCEVCGRTFTPERRGTLLCSPSCKARRKTELWRKRTGAKPRPVRLIQVKSVPRRDLRSDLRRTWEDGDYEGFLNAVAAKVNSSGDDGCWEWTGRIKKGYPEFGWGTPKRTLRVHRMVVEAKHGKPLGALHAHHACGNSKCVNPEHLVAATHAENVAEMLARQSFLARIQELESVVQALAPDHDVLNRVAA